MLDEKNPFERVFDEWRSLEDEFDKIEVCIFTSLIVLFMN